MYKYLITLAAVLCLTACTDQKEAKRALESAGFTQIEFTGYGWFDCNEDDFFKTEFRAIGPTGVKAEGTVCSGLLFKNATIRF